MIHVDCVIVADAAAPNIAVMGLWLVCLDVRLFVCLLCCCD